MIRTRFASLVLALTWAVGCGGSATEEATDPSGGKADASTESGADASADGTPADTALPDTAPDTASDTASDVADDTASDVADDAADAPAPTCTDTVKNGDESDVDCGGSCSTKCEDEKTCGGASDCASGVCTGGACVAASCTDTVKNGDESDGDCGGSCSTKCGDGKTCGGASDCASGVCTGGACVAASCTDTVKNGDESDVDCGGSCATKCAVGKTCSTHADCATGNCAGGICGEALGCAALKAASPALPSGVYTVDPDGAGGQPAFSAYCDMTTAGGGWMRIARLYAGTRTSASINRSVRFFKAAWVQNTSSYTAHANNAGFTLDGATYGMLDAASLLPAATELRLSCNDTTRSLQADAYRTLATGEATTWLDTLGYSSTSTSWSFSKNAAPYAPASVFATAANAGYWGNWHICGMALSGTDGFQLGVCATGPGTADNNLTNLNQIAIGYHAGFAGLRLECTADTPSSTSTIEGTWEAWVR